MRRSLSGARSSEPVSAAKPTMTGRGSVSRARAPTSARMSSVGSSSRVIALAAGELGGRGARRAEVGDGRGHDEDVRVVLEDGVDDGAAHGGGGLGARRPGAACGSGTSTRPATIVTRAPRARAASAIATPILPVLRLPMNRTGSMASAVPPALTTTWRPSRSASRTGAVRGGRAAGSGCAHGRSPMAATTASTISGRSARRPMPDCPDASEPISGGTSAYPKSRCRRSTLSRVARWVHMSPSIAGATTTGAEVARQAAVTVSLAIPFAIAPSQRAVAGAITSASAVSATTMCPIRRSGSRPRTSVSTAWPERASKVSGPTNAAADGVSMTMTSAPSARRRRTSSTAL